MALEIMKIKVGTCTTSKRTKLVRVVIGDLINRNIVFNVDFTKYSQSVPSLEGMKLRP
jgi:hypothetical protein